MLLTPYSNAAKRSRTCRRRLQQRLRKHRPAVCWHRLSRVEVCALIRAEPPLGREDIRRIVALVADLGWHAEVHVRWTGIARNADLIRWFRIPVVIDHLARLDLARGPGADGADALLSLLETGRVWVKTSGIDRVSLTGPPYADAARFAGRLVSHAPERVLWGTDYPHPNITGPAPDDGLLVDQLPVIAPHPDQLHRMLVRNPAEFFGFE